MNSLVKIRFYIWLIVVAFMLIYFAKMLIGGLNLDTNMLNLLPSTHKNPVISQSSNKVSSYLSKQLIFLIGNPDKARAEKAADTFYQTLSHSPLLQSINYHIDIKQQQAWASFYFPYRFSLLTPTQQKLLQQNKIGQIEQAALFNLYSPLGTPTLLRKDPYFLFQHFITSLPKPASKLTLINHRMMVHTKQQWFVMLTAQLRDASFSITTQNQITHLIQASKTDVLAAYPQSKILMTGMLFYAKTGTDKAQHDISTIGIGSLIGIILLILWTFRSLSPLLFILMSSAIGFVTAFSVTQLCFGSIDLFTLVFGASLIGISVDYAFFYYAEQCLGGTHWDPLQGLKNIFNGTSLGLFNIVLAFIVLAFTPFPGLRQLAVFAIVGLSMAYATVVCAFPLILTPKYYNFQPPLVKLTNRYLKIWQHLSHKKINFIYLILGLLIIFGFIQLKANDHIQQLESIPMHLQTMEKRIKQTIGSSIGNHFYLVIGNTPAATLTHEMLLTQALNKAFPTIPHKYIALNAYLPTLAQQKENYTLVKTKLIDNNLLHYLAKIGVDNLHAKAIQHALARIKFKPLTIQAWQHSAVSKNLRFLWLGKIDNQYVTLVLLSNRLNDPILAKLASAFPFVTYVNKAAQLSQIFHTYRQKISWLLIIAYGLLFILLLLRYSSKALVYFISPATAGLISLAGLGWLGVPLTLFDLLALFLVLGIGVDYVLFFAETKSSYQSTMLAVTLSALTTTLSFGLLALSSTPVIRDFGITILMGITSAFILAPMVMRVQMDRNT